ncbi:E3 ubiquitin-protein ligase XIAP-like [Tubulanus polymorphus]|uniref:E3 ubiquitin-protein ligase XIAP-like n=1 Tax=Tubulanus polymorphus TaxID=672921 RepID=UPI003DA3D543
MFKHRAHKPTPLPRVSRCVCTYAITLGNTLYDEYALLIKEMSFGVFFASPDSSARNKNNRNLREMQDHYKRLGTMITNDTVPFVIKNIAYALAFMGFFYTGPPGNTVKCAGCEIEIEIDADSPAEEVERRHKNQCPSCAFVSADGKHTTSLTPLRHGPLSGPSSSYREYNSLSSERRKMSLSEVCRERTAKPFVLNSPINGNSNEDLPPSAKQSAAAPYHSDEDDDDNGMYYPGFSEHHHTWGPDSLHATKHRKLQLKTPSAYPALEHKNSRFATFRAKCPADMFKQNHDDLAGAGFFFGGVEGRLTCFHCGVSIEGWTEFDMPWAEHARHSPDCEFVISMRGQYFVHVSLGVQTRTRKVQTSVTKAETPPDVEPSAGVLYPPVPNLYSTNVAAYNVGLIAGLEKESDLDFSIVRSRGLGSNNMSIHAHLPSINEETANGSRRTNTGPRADAVPTGGAISRGADAIAATKNAPGRTTKEFDIDPREVRMRMDTDRVQAALKRGYDRRLVQRVIETRLRKHGDDHSGLTDLIQDIMAAETDPSFLLPEMQSKSRIKSQPLTTEQALKLLSPQTSANSHRHSNGKQTNPMKSDDGKSSSAQPPANAGDQQKDGDDSLLCKICMSERADVVFIPCGHLMSCQVCAKTLKNCPMCRRKISRVQKVFIS